jgi:hypothetical protein
VSAAVPAIRRRVVVPCERYDRAIASWIFDWARRSPSWLDDQRFACRYDFERSAVVFETDDAEIAAVLAALASDGPAGAERVMALIDEQPRSPR